jgi:hypothetical protein
LTTVAVDVVPVVPVVDDGLVVEDVPVEDDVTPLMLEARGAVQVSPELKTWGAVQVSAPTSEAVEPDHVRPSAWRACWRPPGARLPPTAIHTTRRAATPVARDTPTRRRGRPDINWSPAPGAG